LSRTSPLERSEPSARYVGTSGHVKRGSRAVSGAGKGILEAIVLTDTA